MKYATIPFLLAISLIWTLDVNNEFKMIPLGDLYFSDSDYPIHFEMDLNDYFLNAKILEKNTELMQEKCDIRPNLTNCEFFHGKFKYISELAQRETQYISMARKKRGLITFSIITLVVAISSAITGFFVGVATQSNTEIREIAKQVNLERENRMIDLNHTDNQFAINNYTVQTLTKAINQLQEKFSEEKLMNQLLTSTLTIINIHNKNTERYINALSDNLPSKFFTIIDMATFRNTIKNAPLNQRIKSLTPFEMVQLGTLHSKFLNNTIRITILIPAILNVRYELFNFIPLPIMRDNTTFILNQDAQFISQKNKSIMHIPINILSQCTRITNLTICNSLLLEQMQPPTDCIAAQINKKPFTALCMYRNLQEKYQLIRLTEESIYLYIVRPISLRISCGQKIREINVTKSMEIKFKRDCKIFKRIDGMMLNSSIVKIKSAHMEPTFSIYDNEKWIDVRAFLDQYNIWSSNLYHDFKQTQLDFQTRAKIIKIKDKNNFSKIPNSISNFFKSMVNDTITYFLLYFVLPILIIIIITCCICCCKK